MGESRIGEVIDEDDRQREAQSNAQELGRWEAECAPFIDSRQREQEMDRGGAVEQYRAGQAGPDRDRELEAFFGCTKRNKAERVVDEMSRNVSEGNEAGGQPQGSAAERAELR